MKFIDRTGQRFGKLTVIERASNRGAKVIWRCQCDCGNESYAQSHDLASGRHRSCGCLQLQSVTKHGSTKHGAAPTPEYRTWQAMKQRCLNPNSIHFDRYGGRGITICAEWTASFQAFFNDMGAKPSAAHTLDRINNDGNYEPENCRWATRTEQNSNKTHARERLREVANMRPRDLHGRFM